MNTSAHDARPVSPAPIIGRRWTFTTLLSWLFGLAALGAVPLFASHRAEERAFAHLVIHARPAWLLLAVVLQLGTYVADARIWQQPEHGTRSPSRPNVDVKSGLARVPAHAIRL